MPSVNFRYYKDSSIPTGFLALASLFVCLTSCRGSSNSAADEIRYATISRGNLQVTIAASGTVEPEEVVDVGAQVAGQITAFGKDLHGNTIDFGSEVEQGTVLAEIDDLLYTADLSQAEAQLDRSRAELQQAQAKLDIATRDWTRAQKLGSSQALSQSSYDSFRSTFDGAKAGVLMSQAAVAQAGAALVKAKRNLSYCVIKSPVKGTIIDKRVNIGQTVVASLNAPSLFLLAKDLTRMQVWVSVNEADIGQIRPTQKVQFSVDAFPGEVFQGEVAKIRLNATMAQNVVTYIVEVNTENVRSRLIPYLTANVYFQITNLENVLLISNTALRWSPPEGSREENSQKVEKKTTPATAHQESGTIWVESSSKFRPIAVKVLGSDDATTAIESPEVSEGMKIVTGIQTQASQSSQNRSGSVSPFTPQMGRGKRN